MNDTKQLRFNTGDIALIISGSMKWIGYSCRIHSKGARHDYFIDMHRPFVTEYKDDHNLMPLSEEQK